MNSRRNLLQALSGGLGLLGMSTATAARPVSEEPRAAAGAARVVTLTHLKARPGRLAQLERFVRANWFAMDEIAVEQGLFVSYEW